MLKWLIVLLCTQLIFISSSFAQTKKIAHRSYSGSDFSFPLTMELPDDPGGYFGDYEELQKKDKKEAKEDAKELKNASCEKPVEPIEEVQPHLDEVNVLTEEALNATEASKKDLKEAKRAAKKAQRAFNKAERELRKETKNPKNIKPVNNTIPAPENNLKVTESKPEVPAERGVGSLALLLAVPALGMFYSLKKQGEA